MTDGTKVVDGQHQWEPKVDPETAATYGSELAGDALHCKHCGKPPEECRKSRAPVVDAPKNDARTWTKANWPLIGGQDFAPNEQVVTTYGRICELLEAFALPLWQKLEQAESELVEMDADVVTLHRLRKKAESESAELYRQVNEKHIAYRDLHELYKKLESESAALRDALEKIIAKCAPGPKGNHHRLDKIFGELYAIYTQATYPKEVAAALEEK